MPFFSKRHSSPSFVISACCLLVCCYRLHAAAAQYVIDSWTTANGLPQNSVLSIVQTPDGYLWFATFDGLVRLMASLHGLQ